MHKDQFDSVAAWQNKTFIGSNPLGSVNHLLEEVKELKEEIERGNLDRKEIADCFLLLFSICETGGMSYEDVVICIDEKMEINKKRKWIDCPERGYMKHEE